MSSSLMSFPFWILNDWSTTDGIAGVYEDKILLEFEVRENLFRYGIREVSISFDEIDSVSLKPGVFKYALVLTMKSLAVASRVPGSRRGQVALYISRENKKKAGEAESLLSFGLARRDLRGMRSEISRHSGNYFPEGF